MSGTTCLVLIVGGPGSGKSTVSNIIQNSVKNSLHLKTGQIMRNVLMKCENITSQDKEEVTSAMQHGGLVKDDIVSELLNKEISNIIASKLATIFILDGFPRTAAQLNALMAKSQYKIVVTFILNAPHAILEKRCKMRNLRTDRVDDRKGPVEHRISDFTQHLDEIRIALTNLKVSIIDIDTCDPKENMTKKIEEYLKTFKFK